jgi:hypothetical protein
MLVLLVSGGSVLSMLMGPAANAEFFHQWLNAGHLEQDLATATHIIEGTAQYTQTATNRGLEFTGTLTPVRVIKGTACPDVVPLEGLLGCIPSTNFEVWGPLVTGGPPAPGVYEADSESVTAEKRILALLVLADKGPPRWLRVLTGGDPSRVPSGRTLGPDGVLGPPVPMITLVPPEPLCDGVSAVEEILRIEAIEDDQEKLLEQVRVAKSPDVELTLRDHGIRRILQRSDAPWGTKMEVVRGVLAEGNPPVLIRRTWYMLWLDWRGYGVETLPRRESYPAELAGALAEELSNHPEVLEGTLSSDVGTAGCAAEIIRSRPKQTDELREAASEILAQNRDAKGEEARRKRQAAEAFLAVLDGGS